MDVLIPAEAFRAGVVVGSLVYVVTNVLGEVTGLFISKAGLAASMLSGGIVTCAAGSVAGVIAAETVKHLSEGYFVPVVKRGAYLSGFGLATGVGVATVAVVTLGIHGGRFILNKIRPAKPADVVPIDYDDYDDCDFSVIHLNAVLGNPEGPPHNLSETQKN
jgi:hypothetical protein